ncbi:MAG: hypothetical protein JWN78_1534 [Bacteroidota bacterium]|nr:hypothetical protein [Bacteroidota bacterium]
MKKNSRFIGLNNFFRINLPYGLRRTSKNEWVAFNRLYLPLGFNSKSEKNILEDDSYPEFPIFTKFNGVTEELLSEVAEKISRDSKGEIKTIYLYSDITNPTLDEDYWNIYFEKIKILSALNVTSTKANFKKPVAKAEI